MTKYHQSYHQYLTHPVISDAERAVILMAMAKEAYRTWAEIGGINADYDSLSIAEKERWGQVVKSSFRAMLGIMGDIVVNDRS